MTGVAGVVNAEDLKRFASYFWNEANHEMVDRDEAMRCLRAFLQVRGLSWQIKWIRRAAAVSKCQCLLPQDQLDNEATDVKKVAPARALQG